MRSQRYDLYKMHLIRPENDSQHRLELAYSDPIPGLTVYQTQIEQLRKQVREDPNHFYTYSPEYMSLSVDPYVEKDVKLDREAEHKRKFLVKEGFHNIIKKDPKERIKHPRHLPQSTIEAIRNFPYHEDKNWVSITNQDTKSAKSK